MLRALVLALLVCLAGSVAEAQRLPEKELGNIELGVGLGFGHQTEMWLAGVRGGVRGIGMREIEVVGTFLGGYAAEHFVGRFSVHGRFALQTDGWRFYPLVGPALYGYVPRGRFAEWCDKLQLDACSGVELGVEAGIGAAWRPVAVEVYLGTGQLPLLTIVLSGSFVL